jgi:hypothetical protein
MSTDRTERGRIVAAMSDTPTSDFDQPDRGAAEEFEPVEGQPAGEPDRPQTLEQQKDQARRALEGQGDTEDDDSPA